MPRRGAVVAVPPGLSSPAELPVPVPVPAPARAAPKKKSRSRDSKASFPLACPWGTAHRKKGATEAPKPHLLGLQQGAGGAG